MLCELGEQFSSWRQLQDEVDTCRDFNNLKFIKVLDMVRMRNKG